jgi:hypothetical protein
MKSGRLARLVQRNLQRNRRSFVASAFGVALGAGCLVFFLALGQGLSRAAEELFPAASRELEVVLPQVELGALLGGGRRLDDAAVAELSRLPGAQRAFPKMGLRFPSVTRYNGLFFGKEIHMGLELVGIGLAPELVASETRMPFADPGDDPKRPIPVVINPRLLEIYNKVFAPQRQLPRISEEMITGFTFPVELGRSWAVARNMPNPQESALQIVGFSEHATLAGVSLPLESVRRWNRFFGQDAESYSSVLLQASGAGELSALAAAVRARGFEIDETERTRALQIGAAVRLASLALSLLAVLITGLAAVNIAQAFHTAVRERRRELGVLRAVGASSTDVQRLVLAEASATGLAGGLAGVLGAWATGALLNHLARTRLPDFPFKPERLLHFSPWMLLVGLAVALLAALAGAWLPAREAAALDPARALSE